MKLFPVFIKAFVSALLFRYFLHNFYSSILNMKITGGKAPSRGFTRAVKSPLRNAGDSYRVHKTQQHIFKYV